MTPDPIELSLIDRWQHHFPLVDKPFEIVGRSAALSPREAIRIFQRMREQDVISRVGAVVRPHTIGASTLAAMKVPARRMSEVANVVSHDPFVTHNYEREHELNLWFVVAGRDATVVAGTIQRLQKQTGLEIIDLPMLQAYHLGLGFSLQGAATARRAPARAACGYQPDPRDRQVLSAIEDGLPLVETPYREVAERLGLPEETVIARLSHMIESGIVSRFGCVVRHARLGYHANAMAVWDIPDELVSDVTASFARHPSVTLCYRRPRRLPVWPYNIFCMVHARSRDEAYAAIDELNLQADTGLKRQAVLFSKRCFKQRGAVFSDRKDLH